MAEQSVWISRQEVKQSECCIISEVYISRQLNRVFISIHSGRTHPSLRSHEVSRGRGWRTSRRESGDVHHSIEHSDGYDHGSSSRGHLVDSGERKRSRRDADPRRGSKDNELVIKKFRRGDQSSHRRLKDNGYHGNYHGTTHPPLRRNRDERAPHDEHSSGTPQDWRHHRKHRESTSQVFSRESSRVRDGHKRSRTYEDRTHSDWSQSKRKCYSDGPHRSESQLPVGGATPSSSNQSYEVVPYTSSEANSRGSHSAGGEAQKGDTFDVPSILVANLVPSLPEKFYGHNGDGVSKQTVYVMFKCNQN